MRREDTGASLLCSGSGVLPWPCSSPLRFTIIQLFFLYFYETELGPKLGLVVLAGFSWSPFLADSSLTDVFAFVGKHVGLI